MPARPLPFGLYFMYDVKQFDPAEWSSPPLEARLVTRQALGKVCVGRGAVNQKGPESALLAAFTHSRRREKRCPSISCSSAKAKRKLARPTFRRSSASPGAAALQNCIGVFMPNASQDSMGKLTFRLGAKGIVDWSWSQPASAGAVAPPDIHSSLEAIVDSPAWRSRSRAQHSGRPTATRSRSTDSPIKWPLTDDEKTMIANASKARAKPGEKSNTARSIGSTISPGNRLTSGWNRSRPSTSKDWSAVTLDLVAKQFCPIAPSPRSTCVLFPT